MDIKSFPVQFYVQMNNTYDRKNSVVRFDLERLNVGGAMNIKTGVFMAPRSGTYHFSFAFMKDEQAKAVSIHIRKNGIAMGAAHTDGLENAKLQSSLHATLKLKSGDTVDLFQIGKGNIFDDVNHYTHFTGWLIEEDIEENPISLLPAISSFKLADKFCKTKGFPKSCHDLRCRGRATDGFYLVRSVTFDNKIDTIYCEFSKSTSNRYTTLGTFSISI